MLVRKSRLVPLIKRSASKLRDNVFGGKENVYIQKTREKDSFPKIVLKSRMRNKMNWPKLHTIHKN